MDGSIGSDECYGCDAESYSLLNLETQLIQIEQYTTAMERLVGSPVMVQRTIG